MFAESTYRLALDVGLLLAGYVIGYILSERRFNRNLKILKRIMKEKYGD